MKAITFATIVLKLNMVLKVYFWDLFSMGAQNNSLHFIAFIAFCTLFMMMPLNFCKNVL